MFTMQVNHAGSQSNTCLPRSGTCAAVLDPLVPYSQCVCVLGGGGEGRPSERTPTQWLDNGPPAVKLIAVVFARLAITCGQVGGAARPPIL